MMLPAPFLNGMGIQPVAPGVGLLRQANRRPAEERHHHTARELLKIDHKVETMSRHLAVKGKVPEEALLFDKMELVDERIMPEERLAFLFCEKMQFRLWKALFQKPEYRCGKKNVADLPLLADEYAPWLERGEILHNHSSFFCTPESQDWVETFFQYARYS
ncbi:MAG: hypothetical protein IJ474_00425 [Mailhella sp.]|nr:hypothetical protein [Mailhella sp.]